MNSSLLIFQSERRKPRPTVLLRVFGNLWPAGASQQVRNRIPHRRKHRAMSSRDIAPGPARQAHSRAVMLSSTTMVHSLVETGLGLVRRAMRDEEMGVSQVRTARCMAGV